MMRVRIAARLCLGSCITLLALIRSSNLLAAIVVATRASLGNLPRPS